MRRNQRRAILVTGLILLALLSCQAAANLPNPFATATPTSTPTYTPSPTPTPTLTPTFTPTPPPTGTAKTTLPDGTTLFVDYDNEFSVVLPADWTAIDLSSDDFNKLLESASKNNPELEKTLALLKGMDPKQFRIFAFDFRPDDMVQSFVPNINVLAQNNSIVNAMSLKNVVDVTRQSLPQLFKSLKIISSNVTQTSSNIPIGVIELDTTVMASDGSPVPTYEQLVILKPAQRVISITFASPVSVQTKLLPEFQAVIASLKLLGH